MSRAGAVLLATLLAGAGCGVPFGAPLGQAPVNTCSAASDCAAGATCAQGKCVATGYDLGGLLLQVSMHADATFGVGSSYVIDPGAAGVALTSQGQHAAPFLTGFDPHLYPPVSLLHAKVALDPSTALGPGCTLSERSLPAQITFYRVPPFAGMLFEPVQAITNLAGPKYSFSVDLVSGASDRYDVYIVPQPVAGCPTYPPYFLPDQHIDPSRMLWPLPPLTNVGGSIQGIQSVDAWKVDLVEPSRGLVISSSSVLTLTSGGATLSATMAWLDPDPSQAPILRLTPIDPKMGSVDPTRPTVYWSLLGSVFSGTAASPVVSFTIADLDVTPVPVNDSIYDPTDMFGVPARLTVQSQSLLNTADANNGAFGLTNVTTLPSGAFNLMLPPADYVIRAIPTEDNEYAITDHPLQWSPTAGCVCGRTLPLALKVALSGTVLTPTSQPLASTIVSMTPSQALPRSYLADTHTLSQLETRAATTTSDGSGRFSLFVDQGLSDLTIQPAPGTNLPWLVDPHLDPAAGLKRRLPNPAFLVGTLRDPDGKPIADAQIDAWFPLRSTSIGTAVKIATTSTDENGAYTLVLPSSI